MQKKRKEILPIIIIILTIILFISYLVIHYTNSNKKNSKQSNIINNTNDKKVQNVDVNVQKVTQYNNPSVPDGFKKVETTSASWQLEDGIPKDWNKGLVIEDDKGNQFVWVPVDEKNETHFNGNTEITDSKELPKGISSQSYQIKKYSGFYVSRYEAGVSDKMQKINTGINEKINNIKNIPVSKKGVRPWNYISYENAKINSESMYSNDTIQSGLITIEQFNAISYWIYDTNDGEDIYNKSQYIGNYTNSNFTFTGLYSDDYGKNYKYVKDVTKKPGTEILISCGIVDKNVTNNIYDLAGNLEEMSTYDYKDELLTWGGSYRHNSITLKLCDFQNEFTNYVSCSEINGFRVVLYMK